LLHGVYLDLKCEWDYYRSLFRGFWNRNANIESEIVYVFNDDTLQINTTVLSANDLYNNEDNNDDFLIYKEKDVHIQNTYNHTDTIFYTNTI
jgi:hypothetical protein